MKPVQILIIEDDIITLNEVKSVLIQNHYEVSGVASSLSDAIDVLQNTSFDVAIIDIFLNDSPDGIAFAKLLNKNSEKSYPFVFLTSSQDRSIFKKAKLTHPFSYLLKPFNELELLYAIELALEKFHQTPNIFSTTPQKVLLADDAFYIKKQNTLVKVLISSILYAEVEGHYTSLITQEGKFVLTLSLTQFIKKVKDYPFIRTHRNYLVNLEKIKQIYLQDNIILLTNDTTTSFSNTYKKHLISAYQVLK